jgi:hypothetical protein
MGHSPSIVVWARLTTESSDDPPSRLNIESLAMSRREIDERETTRGLLDADPPCGMFYAVASRWSEGFFPDTVVCLLPLPTPDEDLPNVNLLLQAKDGDDE